MKPAATTLTLCLAFGAAIAASPSDVVRLSEPVEATAAYEVFGAPMADKSAGLTLSDVIQGGDDYLDKSVRITTEVVEVCQKKGCFFIARDAEHTARVKFADYAFFVPSDIAGREVTLVATFHREELSAEQAAHYAEDVGKPTSGALAVAMEYQLVATSVLVPRG